MPTDRISRRHALAAAASMAALAASTARSAPPRPARRTLRIAETAGLRRFGYPVHLIVPDADPSFKFRLELDGKPVPAQFTTSKDAEGSAPPIVRLDFNVSHAPGETVDYLLVQGPDIEPGPVPSSGIGLEQSPGLFRVTNGRTLAYEIPENLLGLLTGVSNSGLAFLKPRSAGLWIRYRDDILYRVGGFGPGGIPTRATVLRKGPLAVGLRFDSTEALRGERRVESRVEMTCPASKSWIDMTWQVDDPQGLVAGLGIELDLLLEGKRALVDFGGPSTIYGTLGPSERMTLESGQAPGLGHGEPVWRVTHGKLGSKTPFAQSPAGTAGLAGKAEGWAHVMDDARCTAAALADFGLTARDRIEVDASGRLSLWRDFAGNGENPPPGPKALHAYYHFVPMPVQIGAATSPQAMLAPLKATWID
ncbi:hypothetical protein EP7_001113 [Isosphaeraceae bacterium EP7]